MAPELSLFLTILTVWVPLLAVALIGIRIWLARAQSTEIKPEVSSAPIIASPPRDNFLEKSIQDLLQMNPFQTKVNYELRQQFQQVRKIRPPDFNRAVRDIVELTRTNRATSIDISAMDNRDAARVMDFANGLTIHSAGWAIQVAKQVIILIPGASVSQDHS